MGVAADRTVSGTVVIDQLDGLLTFALLTGELNIGTVFGGIRLFQPIEGSLTVSKMESTSVVFFPSGISPTGVVTFDELNRVALSGVGCAANSHG